MENGTQKPVDPCPEDDMVRAAPETMKKLTSEFIRNRDFEARTRIRAKMTAILDLLIVDTEYPAVPDVSGKAKPDEAASGIRMGNSSVRNPFVAPVEPVTPPQDQNV